MPWRQRDEERRQADRVDDDEERDEGGDENLEHQAAPRLEPLERREPQRLGARRARPAPRRACVCRRLDLLAVAARVEQRVGEPARRWRRASPRASPPAPRTSPPRPGAAPPRRAAAGARASAARRGARSGGAVALREQHAGGRPRCRRRTAATRPSLTSQSRSATSSTRCGSWLTRITAPPYSVSASTSASRLSMSRWLVGSSRMIRCGASSVAISRLSRAFCPPDSRPTSVVATSAPSPPAASRAAELAGRLVRAQPRQVLQRRLVELELVDLVLGEVADPELRGGDLAPGDRRQPVGEQLRERGLALAVLPEQRDPVVLVDAEVEVAEHRPPVVADADVLEPDDRRRQLLRRREVEAGDVVLDHRGDRLHPLERLDPALRLPRLRRLGAEAVDEGLHVGARRVLLLLLRHLLLEPCPAGVVEGVVAALVERQLLPVQVQDRVDRPVQQVAVVADDEHGVRVAREEALEPDRALEVEVVGRLVEQQHVGPREEHRGQRHPHPPAAGEVGAGAPLRRGVEAEAAAGSRPPAPRPNAPRCRRAASGSRRSGGRPCASSASASSAARSTSAASTVSTRLSRVAGASCATPPIRARFGTSISPASSGSSPRISRNSVVLPLPLRPTKPTLWPPGISTEASSNRRLPSIEKPMLRIASMAPDVARRRAPVNRPRC